MTLGNIHDILDSMRHNDSTKKIVRKLRNEGLSLGEIYEETKVPKTTIRTWIKDIKLSKFQSDRLKMRVQVALQEGRIKNQLLQKELRLKNESKLINKGIISIGKLSKKEIVIAGVALYWAEGFKNKHEHRLGFCNSDPEMIKFYIKWLKKAFNIDSKDLILRLTLNESYKENVSDIENFWSNETGVSLEQFGKSFYQKTKWRKQFNTENYHGVLRVHVKDSLDQLSLMKGLIKGLQAQEF